MSASVRSADGVLALPGAGAGRRSAAHAAVVREDSAALWARRDIVQFAVLDLAGVILMAVAWFGSGDGRPLDRQVPFIDLAMGGLLIGIFGGGVFLLTGLRAVGTRKAAVTAHTQRRVAARAAGDPRLVAGALVSGVAMTRYHRPDCPLVTGKAVTAATRVGHERAGRRPCGVCLRVTAPGPRGQQ
ncbi:MAG TPA: hypothetical protein VGR20_00570 [Acidimicrobiia bacterium]|nr:hypothetical protein [Acidimicrobiia bacterium]